MADLTFSHYTAEPFTLDRDRVYQQGGPEGGFFKPKGLWLSVDGEYDWPSWCRAERFLEGTLRHRTPMRLREDANVLRLSTLEELRAFSAEHARPAFPGAEIMTEIDWSVIAERYDGIVIAPYRWDCRLDLMWYYGWDCASGCIWNLDALA
jgi:hypothetical protein